MVEVIRGDDQFIANQLGMGFKTLIIYVFDSWTTKSILFKLYA